MFRPLVFAISTLVAGCTFAAEPAPTTVLNGHDLKGWQYVTLSSATIHDICHYTADGALAVAGKPLGFLRTTQSYANFRLHAEWRWPANAVKNSNGGVLVYIASGPKDRVWPVAFQVQLKHGRAGDFLPMAGAEFAEKLTSAPGAKVPQRARTGRDAEKPLGEWNRCDLVCRDGTIEVSINGVDEGKVTECTPAAGAVGFQLEGYPYELRNVQITPLD